MSLGEINKKRGLAWLSCAEGANTIPTVALQDDLAMAYIITQGGSSANFGNPSLDPALEMGFQTFQCGSAYLLYSIETSLPYNFAGMMPGDLDSNNGLMIPAYVEGIIIGNLDSDFTSGNGEYSLTTKFVGGKPTYKNDSDWVISWDQTTSEWTLVDDLSSTTKELKNVDSPTDPSGGVYKSDDETQSTYTGPKGPSDNTFDIVGDALVNGYNLTTFFLSLTPPADFSVGDMIYITDLDFDYSGEFCPEPYIDWNDQFYIITKVTDNTTAGTIDIEFLHGKDVSANCGGTYAGDGEVSKVEGEPGPALPTPTPTPTPLVVPAWPWPSASICNKLTILGEGDVAGWLRWGLYEYYPLATHNGKPFWARSTNIFATANLDLNADAFIYWHEFAEGEASWIIHTDFDYVGAWSSDNPLMGENNSNVWPQDDDGFGHESDAIIFTPSDCDGAAATDRGEASSQEVIYFGYGLNIPIDFTEVTLINQLQENSIYFNEIGGAITYWKGTESGGNQHTWYIYPQKNSETNEYRWHFGRSIFGIDSSGGVHPELVSSDIGLGGGIAGAADEWKWPWEVSWMQNPAASGLAYTLDSNPATLTPPDTANVPDIIVTNHENSNYNGIYTQSRTAENSNISQTIAGWSPDGSGARNHEYPVWMQLNPPDEEDKFIFFAARSSGARKRWFHTTRTAASQYIDNPYSLPHWTTGPDTFFGDSGAWDHTDTYIGNNQYIQNNAGDFEPHFGGSPIISEWIHQTTSSPSYAGQPETSPLSTAVYGWVQETPHENAPHTGLDFMVLQYQETNMVILPLTDIGVTGGSSGNSGGVIVDWGDGEVMYQYPDNGEIQKTWEGTPVPRTIKIMGHVATYGFPIDGESMPSNGLMLSNKNLTGATIRGMSSLTTLSWPFYDASNLIHVDVTGSDTSNVTTMAVLFAGCSSLESLDLSNLNTSNVTNMYGMMERCSSLESVDVTSMDTSKAEHMGNMFKACPSLTSLNLSSFNTSNVVTMLQMFAECTNLTTLEGVADFDTSNIDAASNATNAEAGGLAYMFAGCTSLANLDLSNWCVSQFTYPPQLQYFGQDAPFHATESNRPQWGQACSGDPGDPGPSDFASFSTQYENLPTNERQDEASGETPLIGTIVYVDLEGGFYGIELPSIDGGAKFLPINIQDELVGHEGKEIKITQAYSKLDDDDMVGIFMWGTMIFVDTHEIIEPPTPTPTWETMYYDTYPELLGDIVISNHEIDSYNGTYTQVRPTPGVLPGSGDPNAFDGDVESWTPYAGDGHKYPVWVQTNPSDFNKYISFCYSWAGDTKRWVISSSIGGKAFAGPGDNIINTYVGTNPADSDLGTETPPDFGGIPWECTSWKKLTDETASSLTMSNPFVSPTPTPTPTAPMPCAENYVVSHPNSQFNGSYSRTETVLNGYYTYVKDDNANRELRFQDSYQTGAYWAFTTLVSSGNTWSASYRADVGGNICPGLATWDGQFGDPAIVVEEGPLSSANFFTARDLWLSDESAATATYGHISDWDVSEVTNMDEAFKDKTSFNEDISGWDVSNVTSMNRMFQWATTFNQDIGNWNTSKVTDMYSMFLNADAFNQDISTKEVTVNGTTYVAWDTSSVTDMRYMFYSCAMFDQNISNWNVGNVTDYDYFDDMPGQETWTAAKKPNFGSEQSSLDAPTSSSFVSLDNAISTWNDYNEYYMGMFPINPNEGCSDTLDFSIGAGTILSQCKHSGGYDFPNVGWMTLDPLGQDTVFFGDWPKFEGFTIVELNGKLGIEMGDIN